MYMFIASGFWYGDAWCTPGELVGGLAWRLDPCVAVPAGLLCRAAYELYGGVWEG
jgi:hypothetical protein